MCNHVKSHMDIRWIVPNGSNNDLSETMCIASSAQTRGRKCIYNLIVDINIPENLLSVGMYYLFTFVTFKPVFTIHKKCVCQS